jgi:putative ATPase
MKKLGYGKGYKYPHQYRGHFVRQQHLPDSLQGKRYYTPGDQGYEKEVAQRLQGWWPEEKPEKPEKPKKKGKGKD